MLTLSHMITNGVPDAPPPVRLRCGGCPSLATRHHPEGMTRPHGTSARCIKAEGGTRLISPEWQATDPAPTWCPLRRASA